MAKEFTTEREALDALATKYAAPAWGFFEGVPDATGAQQNRRADAVAIGLWPSRGFEVMGFEIKVSRQDFLREMKDPTKAEAVARYCDRWWIVAGSSKIAHPAELPKPWGLMVPHGDRLRIAKQAEVLDPAPVDRQFLAALLQAANRTQEKRNSQQWVELRAEAAQRVKERYDGEIELLRIEVTNLQKSLAETQEQLRLAADCHVTPATIGRAVKLLHGLRSWSGGLQELTRARDVLTRQAEHIVDLVENIGIAAELCEPLSQKVPGR